MSAYQQKAQQQMPYLIDFINENGDGVERWGDVFFHYFIKVKFEENDDVEHMWVKVFEFNDGRFVGTLNNDPNTMKLVKNGDTVTVLCKDVEDWILHDLLTNTNVGHFSNDYVQGNDKYDLQ